MNPCYRPPQTHGQNAWPKNICCLRATDHQPPRQHPLTPMPAGVGPGHAQRDRFRSLLAARGETAALGERLHPCGSAPYSRCCWADVGASVAPASPCSATAWLAAAPTHSCPCGLLLSAGSAPLDPRGRQVASRAPAGCAAAVAGGTGHRPLSWPAAGSGAARAQLQQPPAPDTPGRVIS